MAPDILPVNMLVCISSEKVLGIISGTYRLSLLGAQDNLHGLRNGAALTLLSPIHHTSCTPVHVLVELVPCSVLGCVSITGDKLLSSKEEASCYFSGLSHFSLRDKAE